MPANPDIRVFLEVRGFKGGYEEISKILGVKPDETFQKGDIIPMNPVMKMHWTGPALKRKYSVWRLNARLNKPSYNIEDYIGSIMKRLPVARRKFNKLPKNVNTMLCVWVDIRDRKASFPAIGLSRETVTFLADTKSELDCDVSFKENPSEGVR